MLKMVKAWTIASALQIASGLVLGHFWETLQSQNWQALWLVGWLRHRKNSLLPYRVLVRVADWTVKCHLTKVGNNIGEKLLNNTAQFGTGWMWNWMEYPLWRYFIWNRALEIRKESGDITLYVWIHQQINVDVKAVDKMKGEACWLKRR